VTLHSPTLLEVDPRACSVCGATLDRHESIDGGEGPIHYCLPPDEMTLLELERRVEMVRQIEVVEIVARWEALDVKIASRRGPFPPREPEPYHPAQSTVAAFRLVAAGGDVGRLKAWLADRPKDTPLLLAMLESLASC
jgi:hypothetical protein